MCISNDCVTFSRGPAIPLTLTMHAIILLCYLALLSIVTAHYPPEIWVDHRDRFSTISTGKPFKSHSKSPVICSTTRERSLTSVRSNTTSSTPYGTSRGTTRESASSGSPRNSSVVSGSLDTRRSTRQTGSLSTFQIKSTLFSPTIAPIRTPSTGQSKASDVVSTASQTLSYNTTHQISQSTAGPSASITQKLNLSTSRSHSSGIVSASDQVLSSNLMQQYPSSTSRTASTSGQTLPSNLTQNVPLSTAGTASTPSQHLLSNTTQQNPMSTAGLDQPPPPDVMPQGPPSITGTTSAPDQTLSSNVTQQTALSTAGTTSASAEPLPSDVAQAIPISTAGALISTTFSASVSLALPTAPDSPLLQGCGAVSVYYGQKQQDWVAHNLDAWLNTWVGKHGAEIAANAAGFTGAFASWAVGNPNFDCRDDGSKSDCDFNPCDIATLNSKGPEIREAYYVMESLNRIHTYFMGLREGFTVSAIASALSKDDWASTFYRDKDVKQVTALREVLNALAMVVGIGAAFAGLGGAAGKSSHVEER